MNALLVAWSRAGGKTLPERRRSHAWTKLIATTLTVKQAMA
jgi:hypothetical protein